MATIAVQKVPEHGLAARATYDRDLSRLSDAELLRIVRSLPRQSNRRERACELLVHRYRNLVHSCVHRYKLGPDQTADLIQVGYVGLVKAINNFDPAVGVNLVAYALPCISGEIKRHFRDGRRQLRVHRPVQELMLAMRESRVRLTQQLGRAPREHELASDLGASEDMIRQARKAELALQTLSLDAPVSDEPASPSLGDLIGHEDPRLEQVLDLHAVAQHWNELPSRERRILVLRFYHDMTQAEIGREFGISQMQVSRLLAQSLGYLRERLLGLNEIKRSGRALSSAHEPTT